MKRWKLILLAAVLTVGAIASAPKTASASAVCNLCASSNGTDCISCCRCNGGTMIYCAKYGCG
jgi:hypothetical protein